MRRLARHAVDVKRTFGLILLSAGILLVLTGLNSIISAPQAAVEHAENWAAWYIQGGVALAMLGAVLNPVHPRHVANRVSADRLNDIEWI